MKKKVLLAFFVLIGTLKFASANSSELFKINEEKITAEMSSLTFVENYILDNQGITLSDLKNSGNILYRILSPETASPLGSDQFFESPLGIPSFIWGFCLGVPGIVIVYLVSDEDKEEAKKALIGCIVGSVTYSACYLIYYLLILSSQL